jgi:signal transduction histidine kinase
MAAIVSRSETVPDDAGGAPAGAVAVAAAAAAPAAAAEDSAAFDDELAIRRELLAMLLAQTRTALLGNLVIGVTTLGVLGASGRGPEVLAWFAGLLVLMALRARHAQALRGSAAALDAYGLRRAEQGFTVLLAASGAAWGVLPWLAYTGTDPFVDFFTIAMLVGMTAGAVNSAAALPRAMNLYVVLALAPFVVRASLLGGAVNWGGALTIVFSIVVLLGFGRNTHRAQRATLLATRQNLRLAGALRRERDAVQAASRAKDLFLAGVTHDLRQPVHALALHLRHLRSLRADELRPDVVDDLVAPMDTALRGMSRQLTRLLELSRLEAGEARVSRRAWPLAELFDALEAQFRPVAAERGLALRLRPLPGAQVDTDPRLLQSIVDNLVANALRCTDRGGVLVAARRRAGGVVRIVVADSGRGIDAALLPELFTPYRRFDDRDRTADGEGAGQGLGLALVKKQTELLGHALVVRSVPGRGSVFVVTLPEAGLP